MGKRTWLQLISEFEGCRTDAEKEAFLKALSDDERKEIQHMLGELVETMEPLLEDMEAATREYGDGHTRRPKDT